jgi:hypothetical protein
MRTPNVAHANAYDDDVRVPTTHTLLMNDERDECGSMTIWGFPKGLPQSIGMAMTMNIDSPDGTQDGVPTATLHACHRDALKMFLTDGKLLIDPQGCQIILNELTGLYELTL